MSKLTNLVTAHTGALGPSARLDARPRRGRRSRVGASCLGLVLLIVLLGGAHAEAASAAAVTITPSSDTVTDKTMTVTIAGSTEVNRSLYAYVQAGSQTCPSTAAANNGSSLISYGSDYLSAGAFNRSYTYTPASTGTYTVCSYVTTSAAQAPAATARATFTARAGTATVTVTPSDDPVIDKTMTVTIAGSTEVNRSLYAYVQAGSQTCPSSAAANNGSSLISYGSDYLSAGAFDRSYTYTPASTGTYTVCSYVTETASAAPEGATSQTFDVRQAKATATLTLAATPRQNASATINVAGNTEVNRSLYLYLQSSGPCAATAAGNTGASLISYDSDWLSAGSFDRNISFTPFTAGASTICAYVTKSSSASPDGVAALATSVAPDPNARPVGPGPAPTDSDETLDVGPVAPDLQSPADAASGVLLRPVFRWAGAVDRGGRDDRLRIQRDELDGSTTKVIDITADDYTAYEDPDSAGHQEQYTGDTAELTKVATFDSDAVTVELDDQLPPGRYSWFVMRSDDELQAYSAKRTFTVLGPRLTGLIASAKATRRASSRYPGSTTLTAKTNPYARVRIQLRRQGRENTYFFHADAHGDAYVDVPWSCGRPGGTYRALITAADQYGKTRRASVSFRPVSRARCTSMRRAEAVARRAKERRRAQRQRAADRRAAQEHASAVRRFRHNCNAVGGIVRSVQLDGSSQWVCASPFGGLLPVPGF